MYALGIALAIETATADIKSDMSVCPKSSSFCKDLGILQTQNCTSGFCKYTASTGDYLVCTDADVSCLTIVPFVVATCNGACTNDYPNYSCSISFNECH
jgi:hypothetical protein